MTSPSKRKGDKAELEVQELVRELIGVPARRALGAGRLDDVGDIHGVPLTTIQVADWKDALRAVREKPLELELQRERSGDPLGVTFVRLRGGVWRAVMTPEQWAVWWTLATELDATKPAEAGS